MAVSDWSTNPNSNIAIGGIDISEGCNPAGLNNAIRQLMADVRVFYDGQPSASTFVKLDGSTDFTGQPKYAGRGAFLHHNNSANASGRIFVQASGGSAPAMSNGDWLAEY